MTIWEARSLGVKQLQLSQSSLGSKILFSSPSLDVDCLLTYVLNKDRTYLLSHSQDFLDSEDEKAFLLLLEKRLTGFPVAYLVENKEFFGLNFFVNSDVLIPKPDTELLVEKSIEIIENHFNTATKPLLFADICTGSGCVALSILNDVFKRYKKAEKICPLQCHCTDISKKALDVAHKNALSLLQLEEQDSLRLFEGDLTDALPDGFFYDIIVSNPPYVPKKLVDELLSDGRSEPRIALDGDIGSDTSSDGMNIINRLIPKAFSKLVSGGMFLVETGEYNAASTAQLMKEVGFINIETFNDLAGMPRVSFGRKP